MVSRREIHNRRNNKKQISFFLLKIVALFVLAMFMVSLALYKFKPQVFYFIMNDAISVIKTQQKREDLSRYVEEINTNKEKAKFEAEETLESETKFIEKDKIEEKNILAIIVDDGGYNVDFARRLAVLNIPLTWAIIPYERNSEDFVKIANNNNIPFLVHYPMQAISDKTPPPGSIGEGMGEGEIRERIYKVFEVMPDAIGLNNHRGSLTTSNKRLMMPIIKEIKSRNKMFIDSRTSSKSIAFDLAKEAKIRTFINRGFLDGVADEKVIKDRFDEIVNITLKNGNAVVICHFRPATVGFLEKLSQKKEDLPIKLVTISEMAEIMYDKQLNAD